MKQPTVKTNTTTAICKSERESVVGRRLNVCYIFTCYSLSSVQVLGIKSKPEPVWTLNSMRVSGVHYSRQLKRRQPSLLRSGRESSSLQVCLPAILGDTIAIEKLEMACTKQLNQ